MTLQTGTHAYHVDAKELARRNIPVALKRGARDALGGMRTVGQA